MLAERALIKAEYGQLFDAVSALLFQHDPIGIQPEVNSEYDLEARTILPRLKECQSEEDVKKVVHQEFVRWFDDPIAGPAELYRDMAHEIWRLWCESRLAQNR